MVPIASVVVAASVILALQSRPAVATASSTTTRSTLALTADNLVDGSTETFWITGALPAHVDVRLPRARSLAWVEITNGDNAPFRNTSSHELVVQLFDGETETWSGPASFPSISTDTRRLDTAGARADRIRVTVTSAHGPGHYGESGGCLAEISWDGR